MSLIRVFGHDIWDRGSFLKKEDKMRGNVEYQGRLESILTCYHVAFNYTALRGKSHGQQYLSTKTSGFYTDVV